jgi:hypothetical protein
MDQNQFDYEMVATGMDGLAAPSVNVGEEPWISDVTDPVRRFGGRVGIAIFSGRRW